MQNALAVLLAGGHRNIVVVGDSDQSVYRFRGADISNILDFEQAFPDATAITLDQNFRSTQTILDAANAVIANNVSRKPKALWTDRGAGDQIVRYRAEDEHDEAEWVAHEIVRLRSDQGLRWGDVAVFYRTNAQSRALEEAMVRGRGPLQGGGRHQVLRPRARSRTSSPTCGCWSTPTTRSVGGASSTSPSAAWATRRWPSWPGGPASGRLLRRRGGRCRGGRRRRQGGPVARGPRRPPDRAAVADGRARPGRRERRRPGPGLPTTEGWTRADGDRARDAGTAEPGRRPRRRVRPRSARANWSPRSSSAPATGASSWPRGPSRRSAGSRTSTSWSGVAASTAPSPSSWRPPPGGRLRRAGRRRHQGVAHDPAHRQGARVPGGVPGRDGGRDLPPPALARRSGRARGGAAALLRRHHPGRAPPLPLARLEPDDLGHAAPTSRAGSSTRSRTSWSATWSSSGAGVVGPASSGPAGPVRPVRRPRDAQGTPGRSVFGSGVSPGEGAFDPNGAADGPGLDRGRAARTRGR